MSAKLKLTHSGESEYIGSDGICRHIQVAKFEGDLIGFKFSTYWDGKDKESACSDIVLGIEALVKTQNIITDFLLNIDNFKVEDAK